MTIKILADEVASQIAAGEVVERPVSVVKELLENAIDSGATRVTIRVQGAGREMIEVADNGSGIPGAELSLAVARHATSKLVSAEDLFHVHTLGFRGEALSSIGSVSRLSLLSQFTGQREGARVLVEGGRVVTRELVGSVPGTVVTVENLFFNTPARLKFLKRDLTEKQQIDGLVTRYALAYPHISIRLEEEGKLVYQTSGNGDRRTILVQLYGVDIARQLLEVIFEEENLRIGGFISPISVSRSNRRDITFFTNGRWIQDPPLTSALIKAYDTYLMVGRYPLAVLFIDMPPEEVDVNVHPAKAQVRFSQPDLIFTSVQRAVRRALLAYSPVPQFTPSSWGSNFSSTRPESSWRDEPIAWPNSAKEENQLIEIGDNWGDESQKFENSISVLRLVGQVGATYLVAEGPDGLYLIDQHAAHERILYEKMLAVKGEIPSQALLDPMLIQLPPQQARLMHENLPVMKGIGFDLEEFGPNAFRLSALPALFGQADPALAVRGVVEEFEEDETPLQGLLRERLIARICKRMAVKAGKVMSPEEQNALLRDLESCVSPRTCPHGRPTMVHLTVDLLERQFGRRGARSF